MRHSCSSGPIYTEARYAESQKFIDQLIDRLHNENLRDSSEKQDAQANTGIESETFASLPEDHDVISIPVNSEGIGPNGDITRPGGDDLHASYRGDPTASAAFVIESRLPGMIARLIRIISENVRKLKDFHEKVGKLRDDVEWVNQEFENGDISKGTYELRISKPLTELDSLFPENVAERLDAIYPNWKSRVLGINEGYRPAKSNSLSANSEPSGEELAQGLIEHTADGDFYFPAAVGYIATSMTESQLDAFLIEIRNSEATSLTETKTRSSEATSELIHRIVDKVSGEFSLQDLVDIWKQIGTHNLNPADIIDVIDSRIEDGPATSPYAAHELQDTGYNCGPTLAKVILAQHGKHISEGELTLRALLDGTFDLNTGCVKILFGLFSGCVTPIGGGTFPMQMGYILQRLEIPVDYTYNASLDNLEAALAAGKSVIVAVDVEPIWNGQQGSHVLQVLHIDKAKGVVIVNDTGRSNGSAIEYPLDRFLEACEKYTEKDGILMIATQEVPPSAAREVEAEATKSTSEVSDVPRVVLANGELVEATEEFINLVNGFPPTEDETNSDETERIDDLQASSAAPQPEVLSAESDERYTGSGGGTTASPQVEVLSAQFDEGNITKSDVAETSQSTSGDQAADPVSANDEHSSLPMQSDLKDAEEVGGDVAGN